MAMKSALAEEGAFDSSILNGSLLLMLLCDATVLDGMIQSH